MQYTKEVSQAECMIRKCQSYFELSVSEGWGAFSPVAGLIVARFGEKASFNSNMMGGILVLLPTLLLPTDALKQRQAEKLRLARKLEDQENGLDISQADSQTEDCKGDHRLAFTRYFCS